MGIALTGSENGSEMRAQGRVRVLSSERYRLRSYEIANPCAPYERPTLALSHDLVRTSLPNRQGTWRPCLNCTECKRVRGLAPRQLHLWQWASRGPSRLPCCRSSSSYHPNGRISPHASMGGVRCWHRAPDDCSCATKHDLDSRTSISGEPHACGQGFPLATWHFERGSDRA